MKVNWKRARKQASAPRSKVVDAQAWQDVNDDRGRMAVGLDLPDSYVARAHPDLADAAHAMVTDLVGRALSNGALDEHVPDVADARIQTSREVWDAAAVQAWPARLRTAAQLYAIELQNLATVEQAVAARRTQAATLTAMVTGWQAVLLGQADHAPTLLPAAPAATPVTSHGQVPARSVTLDSPLTDLLRQATQALASRTPVTDPFQGAQVELAAVDGHSTRTTTPAQDKEVSR